jgi:hypothetical protein
MMRIKQWRYLVLALTTVVSLAGCAKVGSSAAATAAEGEAPQARQMPQITRLAVGTLQLEGTDQAVTAEQAKTLLPLWKAYKVVTASESSAPQERDAVVKQISESMTAEQLKTIEALELTPETLAQLTERLGIQSGVAGNMDPSAMATRRAQRGSSNTGGGGGDGPVFFGGPGGPGGGPPGGGQAPNPEQLQTLQAQRGSGGGLMNNTALINKVIEVLAAKK